MKNVKSPSRSNFSNLLRDQGNKPIPIQRPMMSSVRPTVSMLPPIG